MYCFRIWTHLWTKAPPDSGFPHRGPWWFPCSALRVLFWSISRSSYWPFQTQIRELFSVAEIWPFSVFTQLIVCPLSTGPRMVLWVGYLSLELVCKTDDKQGRKESAVTDCKVDKERNEWCHPAPGKARPESEGLGWMWWWGAMEREKPLPGVIQKSRSQICRSWWVALEVPVLKRK